MNYSYITDLGKVRSHNEDNVIIVKNKMNEILLCVCDGMGGHRAGEVASSIAINHVSDRFKNTSSVGSKEDAIAFIKEIVSEANVLIYKYTNEHEESMGMGTTIVLSIITPYFLLFGNIGDSSGYVIKNKRLQKITTDHTLVNLLVKSGELTLEEAKLHPRKNVLLKALGATSTVEMDVFDVERDVDGIFLCSDGLTNMLDDEQILKVLIDTELSVEDRLKKLIIKSNNRGGTDNISCAYLEMDGAK